MRIRSYNLRTYKITTHLHKLKLEPTHLQKIEVKVEGLKLTKKDLSYYILTLLSVLVSKAVFNNLPKKMV